LNWEQRQGLNRGLHRGTNGSKVMRGMFLEGWMRKFYGWRALLAEYGFQSMCRGFRWFVLSIVSCLEVLLLLMRRMVVCFTVV